MKKYLSLAVAFLAAISVPMVVFAAMSSTDYTIYADSIGLGGGLSTSTSYSLEQSISNPSDAVTSSTSATYTLQAGYQAMDRNTLTISLSTSSLDLGTLSVGAVSSASTTVSVTSTAASGYTLSVSDVSGTMPRDVHGGAVAAGTEGYGVAVSGAHAAFGDDEPVAGGLLLASSASLTSDDETTLTFKAAMGSASTPGTYSQTMSVVVSANF